MRTLFAGNFQSLPLRGRLVGVVFIILFACSLLATASPKGKSKDKAKAQKEKSEKKVKKEKTTVGKVYLFGFSQQLTDTIAYMTDIQELDEVEFFKKSKFLPYRSEYSLQVKEYLEGTRKLTKQTACVYFDTKLKKLTKVRTKLKKRYINIDGMRLELIDYSDFHFKNPEDVFAATEDDNANKSQKEDGSNKAEK